eukprot:TRINITY_DN1628_c0_g1_i1.p1 TRINITY_DN1628_c0_g1~~TRINITY_DN1628_c0_g1_i1.p1  ORF type:complete len:1022 (-),score=259.62 TRINITY_DN1628_c0_g1_i1:63-3047(-)
MAATASRNRSPTPSDCQSWEEVEFPEVGEGSSDDDLVLVRTPLVASAERRGQCAARARSRSRAGGSHARRTASPESVSDNALQAPESGSLRGSRNSGTDADTAAGAIQGWWRTRHEAAKLAAAKTQVHSQDTDEDDEVLSEELDEEEDQDDSEDDEVLSEELDEEEDQDDSEADMQLKEAAETEDMAADQYASFEASMQPKDFPEVKVMEADQYISFNALDEATTEPLRRRRGSSTDEEPGAEPEAEAESCNSPKKLVLQPWATHPIDAPPEQEGGQMHSANTLSPQLLTMSQLPLAWRFVAAIALGAVLVLCLAPSAKPVTVVLPAMAPIPGACAAEEATAQAFQGPRAVERWTGGSHETATFTTHAAVPTTGEGNGSLAAELGTDGAVADLLEAMRQDIEAARRTAAAALREAMDAQSSWLTEAKARREAEWAAAEVRRQLQRLQKQAARSNAPSDSNFGSGGGTSQVQKRNPLRRLHQSNIDNHDEERLAPPPPGLLPGEPGPEPGTSRLAGREHKSLWFFQPWAAGLEQIQHLQKQPEPEDDSDADDQLILFDAQGAAPHEPELDWQGRKDLILWQAQEAADQAMRLQAALTRRPSPSLETVSATAGLDITPAPSLATTPAPRLLLDAPKPDTEETLGMLATVRAAWRRHWQGEAASMSAKAAAAAAGQAPAAAPALSPVRAETLQPCTTPSLAAPVSTASGLQQLALLHSKLQMKPRYFNLQQEDSQRKEVLQQPVQQQPPADEQPQFDYLLQHRSQPSDQFGATEMGDVQHESKIWQKEQLPELDHQPLLRQQVKPLQLQHYPFPHNLVNQHSGRSERSHAAHANAATDRLTANKKLKGQLHRQEKESKLELAKQALLQAQQQAEKAWAKAAATLGERTDHFLAKASAWAADAGTAGTQQVEQVRQRAAEVQRQALHIAKTAEHRAQKKLRQAQKKAESIVENARLKASWHLERARQAAETEASKARNYAANKIAEAYSSKLFEAWHF